MLWEIRLSAEVDAWLDELHANDLDGYRRTVTVMALLSRGGPNIGHPFVGNPPDRFMRNLRELRPRFFGVADIRVLFSVDQWKASIFLATGNARGGWSSWYLRAIPRAERAFDVYLKTGRHEPWVRHRERLIAEIGEEAYELARARLMAEAVGWRLADLRHRRGVSKAEIARRAGLTTDAVTRLEEGEFPSWDAVDGYVRALGGSLEITARFGDEDISIRHSAALR